MGINPTAPGGGTGPWWLSDLPVTPPIVGGFAFNAAAYGAAPITDVHLNAAIAAANAQGGGTVTAPPGTYQTAAAVSSTDPAAKLRLFLYGVTIQPAATTDAFFIRQGNGAGTGAGATLSTTIEGVTIDGQSRANTVGVRIRDNDFATIRGVHIRSCTTGVVTESVTAGRWAEINCIDDTFISNCTTGITYSTSGGANPSLGENHMRNVGISGCATGINIVNGAVLYRTRLLGVTVWVPTNGTGLVIDSNVQDSIFMIDFENNNGTSTNCTAVTVTTNAVNVQTLDAHFGFTGTFNVPAVTDAFTKGLVWKAGLRTYTSAANGGAGAPVAGWRYPSDTNDRIQFLTAFAGGGGMRLGDGTNIDVAYYRVDAARGGIDYGLRTGVAGVAGATLYSGSGAPAAGTGANGDFYLRLDTPATVNQRLYVKSAGAWVGIL